MREKREERRWKKRTFREAVRCELREHRSSFLVFSVLRLLVVVCLVRQAFLHNYESVFLAALTLALLYVPSWVQVRLRVEIPVGLEIAILCFIYAAEIMGEIQAFYLHLPFWDTMLHTVNGFLCAAVGFSLVWLLNRKEEGTFVLSPFYLAFMAFCFSMTVGVLWEFFECTVDRVFLLDMQKDTVLHRISTVLLDPAKSNRPVVVRDIADVIVVHSDGSQQALGLGGYVDVGLLDTMKDLFVNFLGAVTFSCIGYHYAKRRSRSGPAALFIPSEKERGRDYLSIARQEEREEDEAGTDRRV